MFSARLPSQLETSRLSKLIAEARASRTELLDLTESNPTRAGFTYPGNEILAGFQDRRSLVYDPDSFGLIAARVQIANLYDVSADRVLLTTSTSESYSWLFKLLCDPGDEILVATPSYPLFELLAQLESVTVRHYPLRKSGGWFIDTHALESSITERTRAIVVVNPNNPTGSFLKRYEQDAILAICEEHRIALISDEVFAAYALDDDSERASSLTGAAGNFLAFSLNGLSKMAGMPQMKLGWIVISGEGGLVASARERLEMIADTYLSVGTPVQYAVGALLSAGSAVRDQILQRVRANYDFLRARTVGTPFSALEVEGGWSAILQAPQNRSEEEWVALLLQDRNVLVQPGYFYDIEGGSHLVLSLITPAAPFQEGVTRILAS